MVSPLFWPFSYSGTFEMLQGHDLSRGIHYLSNGIKIFLHHTQVFLKNGTYDILLRFCYLWLSISGGCSCVPFSRLTSELELYVKTQDLAPEIIFDRRSASCRDHSKCLTAITTLISIWSSIRRHAELNEFLPVLFPPSWTVLSGTLTCTFPSFWTGLSSMQNYSLNWLACLTHQNFRHIGYFTLSQYLWWVFYTYVV